MSAKTGKMDWKLAYELVEANSRVVQLCEPPAPSIAAARTQPFTHALHNQDTEMGDATHGSGDYDGEDGDQDGSRQPSGKERKGRRGNQPA